MYFDLPRFVLSLISIGFMYSFVSSFTLLKGFIVAIIIGVFFLGLFYQLFHVLFPPSFVAFVAPPLGPCHRRPLGALRRLFFQPVLVNVSPDLVVLAQIQLQALSDDPRAAGQYVALFLDGPRHVRGQPVPVADHSRSRRQPRGHRCVGPRAGQAVSPATVRRDHGIRETEALEGYLVSLERREYGFVRSGQNVAGTVFVVYRDCVFGCVIVFFVIVFEAIDRTKVRRQGRGHVRRFYPLCRFCQGDFVFLAPRVIPISGYCCDLKEIGKALRQHKAA